MAQAPPKERQDLFHATSQHERLKLVKAFLHKHTPLATVLQEVVVEFLKGARATTLFVSDCLKNVILSVDLETKNTVHVLAGDAYQKFHADGRGSNARFDNPGTLAVDPASGALLVCDGPCIRRVAADGTVTTLCGHPKGKGYREGVGSAALFRPLSSGGCIVSGKDLFVCDKVNHCIRRIPLDGSFTSLFAGSPGQRGCVNGVGAEAKFSEPSGICQDAKGNLIVGDCNNHLLRTITPAGVVTTLAGSGERGSQDGPAKEASFEYPRSVTYDAERNRVLVVETFKRSIRSIDLWANQVSTIPFETGPLSLAVDCTGDIFVGTCDLICRVSPDGEMDVILKDPCRTSAYRIAPFV